MPRTMPGPSRKRAAPWRLLFMGASLVNRAHTFVPSALARNRGADAADVRGQRFSALSTAPSCLSFKSRTSSRRPSSESGGGDSFTFADLQRELNRRRAEDAMAKQRAAGSSSDPHGMEAGEAFMEEQMALRKKLLKAYVLVYNQGQEEEGVYTLFVEGRNVLRAWEDKPQAARYALMLRAEDLPLGKPTELPMAHIIKFCKEHRVGLELVPRGRGLQPPSRNKPEFDFDCSKGQSPRPGSKRDESLFTPQELARIKRQFEKSLESGEEDS